MAGYTPRDPMRFAQGSEEPHGRPGQWIQLPDGSWAIDYDGDGTASRQEAETQRYNAAAQTANADPKTNFYDKLGQVAPHTDTAEAATVDPYLAHKHFADAAADPESIEAQRQVLAQLTEIGRRGYTDADLARRQELLGAQTSYNEGLRGALGQQLGEQGHADPTTLALMGGQQDAGMRAQSDREWQAAAANRALEALGAQAGLGNRMAGQSFNEGATNASVSDLYAAANAEATQSARRANANLQNTVGRTNADVREADWHRGLAANAGATREYENDYNRAYNAWKTQSDDAAGVAGAIGGVGLAFLGGAAFGPQGAQVGWATGNAGGTGLAHAYDTDPDDEDT